MNPGLIAKKVGMTRVLDEDGKMRAVTVLQLETNKITKVLTPERDGYHAIQIGYQEKSEKHLNKPDLHRLKKVGVDQGYTKFKEFRLTEANENWTVGADLGVDLFEGVSSVDVTGLTKGRGFQGATKRWNHKTGRQTHGSRFHRRPGSLGQRTTPGRVYKNKHMPGHMGCEQRTVQNLVLMDIDSENGVIAVRGSIPGNNRSYVIVKPSIKAK